MKWCPQCEQAKPVSEFFRVTIKRGSWLRRTCGKCCWARWRVGGKRSVTVADASMNVLINLHRGYGLGDAVQMSAVLRHVAKYRPHWRVDLQAEPGRHCVGRGIVANTFEYGAEYPTAHYDAEVTILLYDTWANWHDRPNTRVSSCLRDRFGLDWDAECAHYRIDVSGDALDLAKMFFPRKNTNSRGRLPRVVGIHYQGDSSPERKNLTHAQAREVCREVCALGRTPLLIDWRNTSPLMRESEPPLTTGRLQQSPSWGRDAEMNCAVIAQCEAFVGIDSGPGKCASATDTPTLITWTGHHPAPFHDPAPNTTHHVPREYHGLHPVCDDPGVIAWFERHYNVRHYERDPVGGIKAWLRGVLK